MFRCALQDWRRGLDPALGGREPGRPARARLGLAPTDASTAAEGRGPRCRRARPLRQSSAGPRDLETLREGRMGGGAASRGQPAGTPPGLSHTLHVVRPLHTVVLRRRPGLQHLPGMAVRVSSLQVMRKLVRAMQVLLPLDRSAGACECGSEGALPRVGGGSRPDRPKVLVFAALPVPVAAPLRRRLGPAPGGLRPCGAQTLRGKSDGASCFV